MVLSASTTGSPAARGAGLHGLIRHNRAGATVLVVALLAGVLVASFAAGYASTTPELDNGTNYLPRGNTVTQVNGETQRVENEARALATGKQRLELVVLHDGQIATVNNETKEVSLLPPDLGDQSKVTPSNAEPEAKGGEPPIVVAGKDAGYIVRPDQDTVGVIDLERQPPPPVRVPGGASQRVVPDGSEGIWVLTDDGRAAHIIRDRVDRPVSGPRPFKHLTMADGRVVAITETGEVYDIAGKDLRTVVPEQVPAGDNVEVGSATGVGRYLLVLNRTDGRLVALDPRTRSVIRQFTGLPTGSTHLLGAPVMLDERVYVPDRLTHLLYVLDLVSGKRLADIVVPGKDRDFTLEVREHRVWANDQFDRRAVVVGRDGRPATVDKGAAPGLTDTTKGEQQQEKPAEDPRPSDTPAPSDSAPPATTPPESPPPLVTVPSFAPGTRQNDACDRIRAVNLRCQIVEIGAGGPTGTVRDTDPKGGSRIPERSVVRVRVYGRIAVPNVVGQRTDPACTTIRASGQLTCTKQAIAGPAQSWQQLDVVAEQTPKAGQRIELGATVTVRFWDRIPMENLVGKDGAAECTRIISTSNQLVQCDVQPGGGRPPAGTPPGTVSAQSIPPGTDVLIGQKIVLTSYGNQPPAAVPAIPPGTNIFTACATVQNAGYTCVPVADGVSPNPGVTSQNPPGGTPQQGGNVVVHHEPLQSERLIRWKHNSLPVFIIRFEGEPHPDYDRDPTPLGRAYRKDQAHPGTVTIYGWACGSNTQNCWGFVPNHFYSRGTADPTSWPANWPGWNERNPRARFFEYVNGACPAGQVDIRRFLVRNGGEHKYSVGPLPGPPNADFNEALGCIWNP